MFTLSPHKEQAETRIVLEKHKNLSGVKFSIKYHLFHYFDNRKSVIDSPLKTVSIKESENEILADLIVFERNTSFENYILMFELIPENPEDYQLLSLTAKQNLSLSVYCFTDFEILEIPFKTIDCYQSEKVYFEQLQN